jgi:(p)ppGpp synthase/HD superfamily hydrolase
MTDSAVGYLTDRYAAAFLWALRAHDGQMRHNSGTAYISHLMIASGLALDNGADEDVAIAALLHDMVEDQGVPVSEVSQRFGPRVAKIVADCTDIAAGADRDYGSWAQRKTDHAERMLEYGSDSLLVIGADKVASLQALMDDIATYGLGLLRGSRRSAEELCWNYALILGILEEKAIPIALTARLGHLLAQLRQYIRA